jgi:cysteine-rich repeat protein
MLTLLASAVGVGCSSSQTPTTGPASSTEGPQGSVGLSLVPVSGVTLNSVHYVVANGATPAVTVSEGDLPTPGTAKDFSIGLPLPVGTGYTISLSAAAASGADITCAGSFGPFNVTPNSSTAFTLTLTCKDNTTGTLIGGVDVKTDACPRLVFDYAVATPASANVGPTTPIAVATHAHDLDGKAVTYSWKIANPAVGTFTPTTGATSSLTCLTQGLGQLVTVTAANGECTKDLTTTVSCKSLLCGNGAVDPGETCDTATVCAAGAVNCIPGNKCPSDCTFTCGDGLAEPPAEDCDPGNTAACDSTCHFRVPVCGDGFINGTEKCDSTATPPVPAGSPANSTCSADCTTILSPVCGDGIVSPGEQCDDHGPSATCSNTCTKISTASCVTCENAGDCSASVDNCLGGGAFTGAQETQCYAVMSCIEKNNCLDGTGTLGKCYCGTFSTAACGAAPFTGAGSPDGVCIKEIQAGMPGITTNSAVLGALTASSKPAGAAMQRLNCQKIANSSACLDTCGFTTGGPAFP